MPEHGEIPKARTIYLRFLLYLTIFPSNDPETTIGVGAAVSPLALGNVVVAAAAAPVAAPIMATTNTVKDFILCRLGEVPLCCSLDFEMTRSA